MFSGTGSPDFVPPSRATDAEAMLRARLARFDKKPTA